MEAIKSLSLEMKGEDHIRLVTWGELTAQESLC